MSAVSWERGGSAMSGCLTVVCTLGLSLRPVCCPGVGKSVVRLLFLGFAVLGANLAIAAAYSGHPL